jgi:hypothetical protein
MLSETLTAEELSLILRLVEGDEYTVGFTRDWGQGKLTVINLSPSAELVRALHHQTQTSIPVTTKSPGIHTSLYSRDEVLYLIILNNSLENKTALITIDPSVHKKCNYKVSNLISGEEWVEGQFNLQSVNINIPCKDATILELSPLNRIDNFNLNYHEE